MIWKFIPVLYSWVDRTKMIVLDDCEHGFNDRFSVLIFSSHSPTQLHGIYPRTSQRPPAAPGGRAGRRAAGALERGARTAVCRRGQRPRSGRERRPARPGLFAARIGGRVALKRKEERTPFFRTCGAPSSPTGNMHTPWSGAREGPGNQVALGRPREVHGETPGCG